MASYEDLATLFADSDLQTKVNVAVVIAAHNLLAVTPSTNDQKWASAVFSNPVPEARKALRAVIAANKGATLANISGAGDSAIQTNVDAIVADLVAAYAGA